MLLLCRGVKFNAPTRGDTGICLYCGEELKHPLGQAIIKKVKASFGERAISLGNRKLRFDLNKPL
jgi:hypothetical protein